MSNIAFIGEDDVISLFGIAGIDTFGVKSKSPHAVVTELYESRQYAIICISESIARGLSELIHTVNLEGRTYIMSIPDHTGKNDFSKLLLKKAFEKAIGADILKE
ncbi:MAG: V-type ATP synthase subunit F [Candidatus Omnitrophota bacterium]